MQCVHYDNRKKRGEKIYEQNWPQKHSTRNVKNTRCAWRRGNMIWLKDGIPDFCSQEYEKPLKAF